MNFIKLRTLEIKLEGLKGFEKPNAFLEQYKTPAVVASRFLYNAALKGDIEGMRVFDPGCGTGVLSCGAALLGAEYVFGIDIDKKAIEAAEKNAEKLGVCVDFLVSDINSFECIKKFDTIIMNPPFGAQNVHADRPFIDLALRCGDVVYGIFNRRSTGFIKGYIKGKAEITDIFACDLPMKHTFAHHTKECVDIRVEIVRMVKI